MSFSSPAHMKGEAELSRTGLDSDSSEISDSETSDILVPNSSDTLAGSFNRSRTGYKMAIGGVVMSVLIGAVAITGAIFLVVKKGGYVTGYFNIRSREGVSLALNSLITASTDATGYIHSTTLRWTLARDGRLLFNANLRLLRTARETWENGLTVNIVYALTLVLAYTSASTLMIVAEGLAVNNASINFLISALPMGLLGACLLVQASLASWQLCTTRIPTWSNNPVTLCKALVAEGEWERRPNRCMRSIEDAGNVWVAAKTPSQCQPSLYESNLAVRRIVRLTWLLVPICVLWAMVIYIVIIYSGLPSAWRGTSESPLPSDNSWELDTPWTWNKNGNNFRLKGFTWCFLITATIQAIVTVTLHCSELVVVLSRDESLWRRAATARGMPMKRNPVLSAMSGWQSVVLTISKTLMHWLFGFAMNVSADDGIVFHPWNILYLSFFMLIFAVFISYIALRHPLGPQPAAYGHFQTLIDLIDRWPAPDDHSIFWGHKSGEKGEVCHAGTSSLSLDPIRHEELYAKAS